jgi:hypothetical protein
MERFGRLERHVSRLENDLREEREKVDRYRDYIDRLKADVRKQGYILIDEWDAEEKKVSTVIVKHPLE